MLIFQCSFLESNTFALNVKSAVNMKLINRELFRDIKNVLYSTIGKILSLNASLQKMNLP